MKHIIEKANEIREKYGIDDLELLASKLGAEVVKIPLGGIIEEVYIKDEGVIVIDLNLHPYKKKHLIAHGLAHHLFPRNMKVNYFLYERDDRFNYWKQRRQEKEAEVLAAYLLIPELAEEFQVSENFMRKRLKFKGNRQ